MNDSIASALAAIVVATATWPLLYRADERQYRFHPHVRGEDWLQLGPELNSGLSSKSLNTVKKKVCLATPTGFEPAISALTGPYVRPLHYGAAILRPCNLAPVTVIVRFTFMSVKDFQY